ncbi:site-specific integrase [Flavobacterium sp. LB2P53]|uniref:site-specific integrase n=1 Tax=Flavobacterium sp. LB2P53 TaxID=2497481 RepID=UPI000F847ED6|nr:site-specific integrase [Flavobacterium sp. LB2P53]RTY69683.1 site-specific integrase [Flavobacterium sp. LB2P53]
MIKQNFTVKAILRTDKRKMDGTCPVNYRITINSVVLKLTSGEYSEESDWNAKDGFFKGSKSSIQNSLLDNEMCRIKDYLREQRSIGTNLDIQLVKSFYSTKDSDDFFEFYDKFCEKKFTELSEGTQYHYVLLRKRLKQLNKEIKVSQINLNFIEKFDTFLIKKFNTGNPGRWSRHKNLKAVLGNALKSNIIKKNPYDEFKLTQEETKIEYLIRAELMLIEKIRFSSFTRGEGLNITRDMFLFSCYTGLRYSDVIGLTKKDIINGESISMRMQKTQNLVQVPLTDKAKMILKKYNNSGKDDIFPKRCNVTVNRDLKIIASLCKIKKKVHFHVGRHTFASTLANENVSSFIIMKLLGHKDIKMTQRYVDNSLDDISKMLNTIKAFKKNP